MNNSLGIKKQEENEHNGRKDKGMGNEGNLCIGGDETCEKQEGIDRKSKGLLGI